MSWPDAAAELIRGCYSFIPGDLVGAMELKELTEELLSRQDLTGEQRSVVERGDTLFEEGMKNGFSGGFESDLEQLKTRLPGLFPEEADQSEKQREEEKQSGHDIEVLDSFIQESQDHLENMEEQILGLEDNPDPVAVNSIFRSMHTIKGVASFIGLTKIKNLSHSLESVLDKLRSEELTISTDLIDVLLAGVDLLTRMIGELIEKENELKKPGERYISLDSDQDIRAVLTALESILEKSEESLEETGDEIVTPEMIAGFKRESTELIESVQELFELYRKDTSDTEPLSRAFRSLHTVKGNAGFLRFGSIEQVCANLQQVIDRLQQDDQDYDERIAAVIDDSLKALKGAVLEAGPESEGAAETFGSPEPDISEPAEGPDAEGEGIGLKPLGEALVEMGEASSSAVDKALDRQQRKLGEILVESGYLEEEQVSRALEEQQKRQGQPAEEKEKTQRRDIRVDTDKLDKLFDLMGELITAQAMVIDNPDLEQYNLERFQAAAGYLSKVTREMQEVTMLVRMVPLEGLFNKMRRLVRDLSRSYDKKVNLDLSGQDTEMDRNIMDDISEPLVNVIENAVRHGIEIPKVREEVGKQTTGIITLDARYEGNEIWISVKDDGRGLDREVILEKARSLGLVSEADADKLSDTRVWALIMQPGFSAAVGATGAGRGEGLDKVKRAIEQLKGRVDIFSQKGKGTEILLRIPQTQALIDGIIFKVADKLYSMPISDVLTFHKAEAEQVTVTKRGREVLNLRGELIPILKLYEMHRIATEKRTVDEGIVMIILADNKKAALLVDEILDYKQLVVKPLPESMGIMRGVSGCSIMGDGNVSLIIDTPSLVNSVIE